MVITVRAHCNPLDISPTAQAVWALSWTGWRAPSWDVHFLHYALLTVHSLSTLVTSLCSPNNVYTYFLCPKCRSCHKAIMVITVRAHCNPLDIYEFYILSKHSFITELIKCTDYTLHHRCAKHTNHVSKCYIKMSWTITVTWKWLLHSLQCSSDL